MCRDKNERERTRRRCRRRAEQLGCEIEIDRVVLQCGSQITRYWVWGPEAIYNRARPNARDDPLDKHRCACWCWVEEALAAYALDLAFFARGFNSELTRQITSPALLQASEGMIGEWWLSGFPADRGLVLADWLDERGYDDLAAVVRAAARSRSSI